MRGRRERPGRPKYHTPSPPRSRSRRSSVQSSSSSQTLESSTPPPPNIQTGTTSRNVQSSSSSQTLESNTPPPNIQTSITSQNVRSAPPATVPAYSRWPIATGTAFVLPRTSSDPRSPPFKLVADLWHSGSQEATEDIRSALPDVMHRFGNPPSDGQRAGFWRNLVGVVARVVLQLFGFTGDYHADSTSFFFGVFVGAGVILLLLRLLRG